MIEYRPRRKARREDTMNRLRTIATSTNADSVMTRIQRDAEALMAGMSAIHGGRWSIDINHRSCFVLVARDGD